MRLKLIRDDKNGITVKLVEGTTENEFSYIKLIEYLRDNKTLDEPEFVGDISEEEKTKLNEMIYGINEAVVTVNT